MRVMGLQPGRRRDACKAAQGGEGLLGVDWGWKAASTSPEAGVASSKQPSQPCVFVCGRERELSCSLPAAGPCKPWLTGHCSLGSTEGTGISQPLFYFKPGLMGTARTSGNKVPACSGLVSFPSFRDLGKSGDEEHCAPLQTSAESALLATPIPHLLPGYRANLTAKEKPEDTICSFMECSLAWVWREDVPLILFPSLSPGHWGERKPHSPRPCAARQHLSQGTEVAGLILAALQTVLISLQEISTTVNKIKNFYKNQKTRGKRNNPNHF